MNTLVCDARIVQANGLTADHIQDVATGKISAVRVPDFYPQALCDTVSEKLRTSPSFGFYANAPDIGRVGMAFYECIKNANRQEDYFQNALTNMAKMREIAFPYLSPFDLFRLTLDEVWPHGASLARINSQRAFAGLARVFSPPSGAMPHQDILFRDAPSDPVAAALEGQLAMNVYLQEANEGGEIELWDWIPTEEEHERLRHSDPRYAYGLNPSLIRAPDHVIRPKKGELILFHPWNVHAVRPVKSGIRVTWSCFVGFTDAKTPLVYWS